MLNPALLRNSSSHKLKLVKELRISAALFSFPDRHLQSEALVKISIVIPVINEATTIANAIERAWQCGADELIVVDGGSTDGTIELVQQLDCTLLSGATGRGRQMNHGAQSAQGDVLLFLHADNWLGPGACQQIRTASRSVNSLWGGFRQRIANPAKKYRWLEAGNAWRANWHRLIYGDQAMFISSQLFRSVHGFPDQPLMEDFEISRILGRVARPVLLPGPVHVSARRWEQNGVVRQTLLNWTLVTKYRLGYIPEQLQRSYHRHDQT